MNDNNLPAIAGGMSTKQTPYGEASRYGEDELTELREALEQNTLFYAQGQKVKQLETDFASLCGAKFAIACSSGTAALHAACTALEISPGDEVIVPPITDMGTLAPLLYQGAVPVFADVTPHGYVLDANSVSQKITARTRAIIAVHLWGNACDLEALQALCKKHTLLLIEDCAQAFGSLYKNQKIGTIGDVGCFSFNEFKHISCGDGGIVVTNNEALAHRLRLSTDKCYDRRPEVSIRQPTFLANNYRMTELQAAVARAQLHKLDSIVEKRRQWCENLSALLTGIEGIYLPQATTECNPSWWFYMLRVTPALKANADEFCKALQAEGIRCSAHYIGEPVYRYPLFVNHSAFARGSHPFQSRDYGSEKCLVAEAVLQSAVMLPVNENFTSTDADEIARGIRRVARWFSPS